MALEKAFAQLNIVQDFIPRTNSNRPGTRLVPTHITIHNTDNASPGADAAAHARYVKGQDAQARQVSWHYTVDDRVIYQSLPANEVGWHSGPGNSKSIGIEICMHQGMDETAAYDRAALLVAVLAQQNGIAVPANVVQHNHWTGKHCPRVLRDRPNGWSGFLAKVQAALDGLRSIPKAVDAPLTHGGGDDFCEVLSRSAGKGAARGEARKRKAPKRKAKKRKTEKRKTKKRKTKKRKTKSKYKTKAESNRKARQTKTGKRPRRA
jgi:N-acetylmuramoyl-L-alanine amidase CwlA